MTETLLIEVKNKSSLNILKELELLDMIKVIKQDKSIQQHNFLGTISKETAKNLIKSIQEGKEEWDKNIS